MLLLIPKILLYFFTQKCFGTLSIWSAEEIHVGSRLLQRVVPVTYLLTPWSKVLLEKLTSKLCS